MALGMGGNLFQRYLLGVPAVTPPEASMPMNWQSHIVRDPSICAGEPVFCGTRVTLRTVLASLAEGARIDEILRDFPSLNEENVRAAIAFAAASAGEDLPVPGAPSRT
jgi:uncharacterized protein (DUF433 family)